MALKSRILILDDDTRIVQLLKKFLVKNGFEVDGASSVPYAHSLLQLNKYDLIILDVMLTEKSGIEFAREIRKEQSNNVHLPIVMLTALSSLEHKIAGLEAGATDYITKPFEPRELLLRISNLLLLSKNEDANKVLFDQNKYYDTAIKDFINYGSKVYLSSTESKLLEILIEHNGSPISREELSQQMGGLSDRSIDVQIARLRSKIEDDPKNPTFIKTVRHQGYAIYK